MVRNPTYLNANVQNEPPLETLSTANLAGFRMTLFLLLRSLRGGFSLSPWPSESPLKLVLVASMTSLVGPGFSGDLPFLLLLEPRRLIGRASGSPRLCTNFPLLY